MATPLGRALPRTSPRTSRSRPALVRRGALALLAVVGTLFATVPAQAAPATSAEAAQLVAARGRELEVITEQFNEARDVLEAQQEAAKAAAATMEQATAQLAAAQQQVRGLARTAYTGEGLGPLQALLTSESADAFVDRVATLQLVAGHQAEILDGAAAANVAAAQAQATAQQAAVDAQATYDRVLAQQAALQAEVDSYQAAFNQLSAQEQQVVASGGQEADRASRDERTQPVQAAGPVAAGSEAAQIIVDTAMAQRGKPYVWAASGPNAFDCSGLTSYAYRAAGIDLPRASRLQAQVGRAVSRAELQPGDLVAFYSPVSHIGIYIGNGQMVHAPTSGDMVKVSNIDSMGSITAMRRVVG